MTVHLLSLWTNSAMIVDSKEAITWRSLEYVSIIHKHIILSEVLKSAIEDLVHRLHIWEAPFKIGLETC
jgi:hypothetical protein